MNGAFRSQADAYWDRGYSVIPLQPGTKRPAKDIAGWSGYCNGPPNPTTRQTWKAKFGGYGIGLLLSTEFAERWRIGAVDVDDDAFVEFAKAALGNWVSGKRGAKGATILVKVDRNDAVKSTTLSDHRSAGKVDILINGN